MRFQMIWYLKIERKTNGYVLKGNDNFECVIEDAKDELDSHEKLLWQVMEYFSFVGNKYDKERLRIVRQINPDL